VDRGVLVVDSRIIAQRLKLRHSYWFNNFILKRQAKVEEDFGAIRFETAKPKGFGRAEKYALLTEAQIAALFVYDCTLSNSIDIKADVDEAFEEAKDERVANPPRPANFSEEEHLRRNEAEMPDLIERIKDVRRRAQEAIPCKSMDEALAMVKLVAEMNALRDQLDALE